MMYVNLQGKISNVAIFSKEIHEHVHQERQLRSDLVHALHANELYLDYQPIVNADKEIVSIEALVRWNHPTKGLIRPAQFIPIAERSGLIVQLGEWVLRSVCAQAKTWQEEGIETAPISVNIAPSHYYSNIVSQIEELIIEFGISPDALELEITESHIMHDIPEFIKIIHKLKALGIHISIDDFGTGYSSLSYLYHIPAKRLKLDRLFIQDLQHKKEKRAALIVKSIIELAHQLNMEVVAEGIEEMDQFHTLVAHGCDHFQGYLFSRPVSPNQIEDWFPKQMSSGSRDWGRKECIN